MTIEEIFSELLNWLLGGIALSTVVSIILILVVIYLGMKVTKGILIQSLLLIVAWLPSIIITFAIDTSTLEPQPIIPLRGVGLVLFPYTWDTLFGWFVDTQIGVISLLMIVISYIAFLHLSIIFCKNYQIKVFLSPIIAYIVLVGLGLGMINFHSYLFNSYVNYAYSIGIHPIMPVLFLVFLFLIVIIMVYSRKPKVLR